MDILHERRGPVTWFTLDRPERGNAITPDQRDRLIDLLADASADVTVRAVVLTGAGDSFSTGADLSVPRPPPERPEGAPDRVVGDVARMMRDGAQRLMAAVLDCEKPVVAAVNGTAAGIGAHLVWAADLVVAAEGARFIEVFVRRGIIPDGGGSYLLPRLIGLHRAKELLLLGDDLSAADALHMGLVNRVVPADRLEAEVTELADRLAAGPTRALGLTKRLVNRSLESNRAGAFADEAWAQEVNMGSHDAVEGMTSFRERRRPDFKGW